MFVQNKNNGMVCKIVNWYNYKEQNGKLLQIFVLMKRDGKTFEVTSEAFVSNYFETDESFSIAV